MYFLCLVYIFPSYVVRPIIVKSELSFSERAVHKRESILARVEKYEIDREKVSLWPVVRLGRGVRLSESPL